MANYNLIVDSKFQPFSFERYIQPYQLYGQAYKEVEDQYADLNTKASVWEKLAEDARDRDSKAYNKYKSYSNDLHKLADQLATEGLTPSSRQSALSMKSRYSSDITPIEEAYINRQKAIDRQNKLKDSDPDLKFERDLSIAGIDNFINNTNYDFGRSFSGKDVTNKVALEARELSKNIRNNPEEWKEVLGGEYYQSKKQQGYTLDEILMASIDDPSAPQELKDIVYRVIDSTGIKDWEGVYDDNKELTEYGKNLFDTVHNYAVEGLPFALGDTDLQYKKKEKEDSDKDKGISIEKHMLRNGKTVYRKGNGIQGIWYDEDGYTIPRPAELAPETRRSERSEKSIDEINNDRYGVKDVSTATSLREIRNKGYDVFAYSVGNDKHEYDHFNYNQEEGKTDLSSVKQYSNLSKSGQYFFNNINLSLGSSDAETSVVQIEFDDEENIKNVPKEVSDFFKSKLKGYDGDRPFQIVKVKKRGGAEIQKKTEANNSRTYDYVLMTTRLSKPRN